MISIDNSDEEGARLPHAPSQTSSAVPPKQSATIATQTPGSWLDHIQALAENFSLTVIEMKPLKDQFWAHFLACMKMPRGGVNGAGSMHCEFEFVAPNERSVPYLMEDLPLRHESRYNLSIASPHWETSKSISTYHALDCHLIDSYMRLHRRPAANSSRAYHGSVLAAPPDSYPAPVAMLSVSPPLLIEFCRRKHGKMVLAVSFNLNVMNDAGRQTLPPKMPYAVGMGRLLELRSRNHLIKLLSRHEPMSANFRLLAANSINSLSDSEGDWVAPPNDLTLLQLPPRGSVDPGLDSGEEADSEAENYGKSLKANVKRPRAVDTRWQGKFRQK